MNWIEDSSPVADYSCFKGVRIISVGVIGGADGPTAIFVASPVLGPAAIAAAIVIIGGVIFFFIKRKRKKG
jgi:Na+-transporting methylmalonyl-CoA/oxaloacetate decarboxylase, beta subunit